MTQDNPQISIILPTYNESQNIVDVLKSIRENLPKGFHTETIVVDDNSPDGTGKIVDDYISNFKKNTEHIIDVIHRKTKNGLASAIVNGIQNAKGELIVVMDSDFSHPPQIIPKLISAFKQYQCDIAIASRYVNGGKIHGWPLKRKIMSKIATGIARKSLGVESNDPMSGFFAFRKNLIQGISFDAIGYKILLEMLVKTKGVKIQEIPYTFRDRRSGSSKVDTSTVLDYFKSVWKLYRYGKSIQKNEKRTSVRFISKAGRFYSVGATGFIVNYLISLLLSGSTIEMWYLHANIVGIVASMTSNFVLNKIWTFEDRDFNKKKTVTQYGKFVAFSSIGALIQLGMVYWLVDSHSIVYPVALSLAVLTAAFGNFVFNKKWTFKEKVWS